MSKYRKAFVIGLASIALTITGFCIRGIHRSSPLSRQADNIAPPPPGTIEIGSVVKSDDSCWRPSSARNIGIAELSCDFWERQIGSGGTNQ